MFLEQAHIVLCDDRSHVLHTRITHFHLITACEFSVAVTDRKMALRSSRPKNFLPMLVATFSLHGGMYHRKLRVSFSCSVVLIK